MGITCAKRERNHSSDHTHSRTRRVDHIEEQTPPSQPSAIVILSDDWYLRKGEKDQPQLGDSYVLFALRISESIL